MARARVDAAFPPQAAEAAVREDALLGVVLLQDEAKVRLLLEQGVRPGERFPTLEFEVQDGAVVGVALRDSESWMQYERVAATR